MDFYLALIHPRPAGYDITVPDCPGCTASANTKADVMRAGMDALRLWAEAEISAGRAVPAPREFDEARKDPDVAAEMAEGATAALLKLMLDKGRSQRVNVTFDAGLLEEIDEEAKARGLTRSAFLASAARDKIAAG